MPNLLPPTTPILTAPIALTTMYTPVYLAYTAVFTSIAQLLKKMTSTDVPVYDSYLYNLLADPIFKLVFSHLLL